MKLFLNEASPYARLARILLLETGLESETGLVFVDPWASPETLLAVNPAGKIPALLLDSGTCLAESSCIADYLLHRARRREVASLWELPDAVERAEVLGLGRGAMDCAFGAVVQERFAASPVLQTRWQAALPRLVERLEALLRGAAPRLLPDLADLTVGVALDYIGFRLPEIAWRAQAPALSRHVTQLTARASFQATRPK